MHHKSFLVFEYPINNLHKLLQYLYQLRKKDFFEFVFHPNYPFIHGLARCRRINSLVFTSRQLVHLLRITLILPFPLIRPRTTHRLLELRRDEMRQFVVVDLIALVLTRSYSLIVL